MFIVPIRRMKGAFLEIKYKTKRLGEIAYYNDGTPAGSGLRPVFVQKQEFLDNGVDPDKHNPDILPPGLG